jgi:hypothetical protein
MLDPLCRTCGERHRYGPCPQKSLRTPPVQKPVVEDVRKVGCGVDLPTQGATTPAKFDWVKYQREYMRKKRALKRNATTRT